MPPPLVLLRTAGSLSVGVLRAGPPFLPADTPLSDLCWASLSSSPWPWGPAAFGAMGTGVSLGMDNVAGTSVPLR